MLFYVVYCFLYWFPLLVIPFSIIMLFLCLIIHLSVLLSLVSLFVYALFLFFFDHASLFILSSFFIFWVSIPSICGFLSGFCILLLSRLSLSSMVLSLGLHRFFFSYSISLSSSSFIFTFSSLSFYRIYYVSGLLCSYVTSFLSLLLFYSFVLSLLVSIIGGISLTLFSL